MSASNPHGANTIAADVVPTRSNSAAPRRLRFGVFELDLHDRELRKRGIRLRLQYKPFQILERLLLKPGELVTRMELAQHLWPNLNVVFDRSLNTAVNALRRALNDPSRNPRFIETRPGIGYRFIAPVEVVSDSSPMPAGLRVYDSIAVLPFENTTGDAVADHLAGGVAEGIIGALSASKGLRVLARSACARFRGPDLDPLEAGSQLGTRAVLTGRMAGRAGALAISVELVDVETGQRLWGREYSRAPAEIVAIEKDIAEEVARTLGYEPYGDSHDRTASHSSDFNAYLDYLKGRYFYDKMTEDALRKSVAYFEAALAADSNYALAHAGLADAYGLFALLGILPPKDAYARVKEFSASALRIDGRLAEAHVSLAGAKKSLDWDWPGAEREYQRALELDPHSARAHHLYAVFLAAMEKHEEAAREIRRAQELDPLSLVVNMQAAWILYIARDYQAALEQSWKTLAMEPRFAPAQNTLGLAYEQMGATDEAIVEFRNARACSDDHPASVAALGHAYATAQLREGAQEGLLELQRMAESRYVSPYWLAILHTGLGEHDRAFESLERACEDRDGWLIWLKTEPRFDPLRSDARFARLLGRLGL